MVDGATGPVRFGFLGVGGIVHRALLPAVRAADGAVLQAAAARDLARAEAADPEGRAYDDYTALLEDPEVEVVYISLPNDYHRPWTLAALAAGKHVLCEKPLGLTAAEVEEMHAAAAAADRLLVEAFWYRWHPRTRRLEQLAAEGAFGTIGAIEADFSFDADWSGPAAGDIRLDPARGGGALYDVGCYAASAAVTVLTAAGRVSDLGASEVRRTTSVWSDRGVDLRTSVELATPPATAVTLRCGIAGRASQTIEVAGDHLRAEFPGGSAFSNRDEPSTLVLTSPGAEGGPERVVEERFAPVDPYRVMVEHVAAAVRGAEVPAPAGGSEAPFLVDAAHSRAVAALLDAARAAFTPPDHPAPDQV